MRTTKTLEAPRPADAAASHPPGFAAMRGPGRVMPRQVRSPGIQVDHAPARAGKPGAGSERAGRK